jgi:L-fucose mutarotase
LLNYTLVHPPLLSALATAGHGSMIMIADGNYPYSTMRSPNSELVHLNLRPGLLDVPEVLRVVQDATNFESAVVMDPEGAPAEAHSEYQALLGPDVPMRKVERFAFYELVRSPDVGLVIATGDQRLYANLLLTVGLR